MTDLRTRLRPIASAIETHAAQWGMGLLARLLLLATIVPYYLASAKTKVGEGVGGFFDVQAGAYGQIIPPIAEAHYYDASMIPIVPWKLIVIAGTYAEFILPILIVVGLLTRPAAIGLIGFIIVQSYVDHAFHGVTGDTFGAFFDRDPTSLVLDQRAFWSFPLLFLALFGPGAVSLDRALSKWRAPSATGHTSALSAAAAE